MSSRRVSYFVAGMMGLMALPGAFALDDSARAPISTLSSKDIAKMSDQLVVKTKKAAAKQMWNMQNADIRAVVQTVSQLTGKNFIVDPRVQGKITLVSAKPMSVNEMYKVFLSMLQVLNYAAIPSGGIIKIVPAMDAKGYGGTLLGKNQTATGDQVVVRVVPVNNVSAEQLVSILRPLMLDWGSVHAYQPSNSLVLAGSAANVNQLVTIVHNLDGNNGSTVSVAKLKYADATKLAQVIQSLQSVNSSQGKVNNVSIVADAAENALLVSGNESNRDRALALIKQLDTANAAGGNNTAVVHLNYLTAKTLAPMLTKLAHGYVEQAKKKVGTPTNFGVADTSSNANVSIQAIETDNAVVISGPHEVVRSLQNVIKKIDTRPQQVLVQAIIVQLDQSKASKMGIQWGSIPKSNNQSSSDPYNIVNDISPTSGFSFQNGMGVVTGLLPHTNLGAVITALKSSGDSDILATPSVLVLNNGKASLSDGKNVGMLTQQANVVSGGYSGDETLPVNSYDRKDVTLSLNVVPQIAPDNTVKLSIKQQNDTLAPDTQGQNPANPTINTSKINTAVLVNSGDILVLGGLSNNNNTETDQKIPLLGDIPLLGRLFHYKTHNLEKKDLMVFIRPIIINNKKQGQAATAKQYNYIRYQQIRKRDGLGLTQQDMTPVLPYQASGNGVKLPSPFS